MDVYGIIGKPLQHSESKPLFNNAFIDEGIDAGYISMNIGLELLIPFLHVNKRVCGFNVTHPYKEAILPMLDEIDSVARMCGSVNCVRVVRSETGDIRLIGYNTDYAGVKESFRIIKLFGRNVENVLILGTGAVAKTVQRVLWYNSKTLVVSRTPGKGDLTYEELTGDIIRACDVIINTTPLGMYPHENEMPNIPYGAIVPRHTCIDVIYNPRQTPFLSQCLSYGATTLNGYPMFLKQAQESARTWMLNLNIYPDAKGNYIPR